MTDLLGALEGTSLLDLDADLTADLDLAAPITAAVAANANGRPDRRRRQRQRAVAGRHIAGDRRSGLDAPAGARGRRQRHDGAGLDDQPGRDRGGRPAGRRTGADREWHVASLLDIDVDLDLALDLAAPIDAALAANLNIAAPIDAAVSANLLSPGSTSLATADQDSVIVQSLTGSANATGDQTSLIEQGEEAP